MRFFFRESPSVADENFPFFIFFDAEFFSHPHGDIRKYKFCKKYSQMAPETLRLPYLTRHKITFLQIILWKAGREKTLKEIPSPQLLELWKWQGQVSCRARCCLVSVMPCLPQHKCCSFAGWVRVCAGAVLVLTGACHCYCAPAAASQGIRAGGTKTSHSNLSSLLALNTSVSLSKLEVTEEP